MKAVSNKTQIIEKEMRRDYERWTDLLLERRNWYMEQKIRLVDRTRESIIFYSSVAGVFLTIATPLIGSQSFFISLAFWSFLFSTLLGILLVGISIFIDEKELPVAKEGEISVLKKLQLAALKGINDPSEANAKNYLDVRANVISEIESKESINHFKRVLQILYYLFLTLFVTGFVSIALNFACKT